MSRERPLKKHFRTEDAILPVCGMSNWEVETTDNYVEVDCRNCKDAVNRMYRFETAHKYAPPAHNPPNASVL